MKYNTGGRISKREMNTSIDMSRKKKGKARDGSITNLSVGMKKSLKQSLGTGKSLAEVLSDENMSKGTKGRSKYLKSPPLDKE